MKYEGLLGRAEGDPRRPWDRVVIWRCAFHVSSVTILHYARISQGHPQICASGVEHADVRMAMSVDGGYLAQRINKIFDALANAFVPW